MIRTPTFLKATAWFFLCEMALSLAGPGVAHALTAGANQSEYTSYEPVGTTDMVNLITGDFTYNVPLIDIPSPEGGFSLPLSYHSGIGLEDEASWAGLGWNVNAGAISRNKVGSADDDFDNVANVHVADPGGSGYVKNFIVYQRSWDSQKGFGGAINLLDVAGISWGQGQVQDATILGLTFDKDKAKFSPEQAFNGIATIASFGATSTAAMAAERVATKGAVTAGMQATRAAAATGMNLAMTGQGLYSGYKSQGTTSGNIGEWSYEKTSSNWGFRQDYRYWLDATREEHGYGALYLGQMQKNTSVDTYAGDDIYDDVTIPRIGSSQSYQNAVRFPQAAYRASGTPALVSDMYTYVEPNANYAQSFNPTHVAYDAYSVMGPAIGGRIAPYRPDVGSLVFPKKLGNGDTKINLVPFLEEGRDIAKIQFKYEGELSNKYEHHDSGGAGMSVNYATSPDKRVYYNLTDSKLRDAPNRVEADREGLYNKRLAQGKHVEWFTNAELLADGPARTGLVMEYRPLDDNNRRTNRATWPEHGIGAYAITNADGTTYHYALLVYNKGQKDFTGVRGQEASKYSETTTSDWYATTWLLTAVTGPDFVDRGQIGTVDAEDYGYWVKFDYGRFASEYQWRFPYSGYTQDGDRLSYSKGTKETYYLNSIQTRSHTALFLKDVRKDGRGAYRLTANNSLPAGAGYEDNQYPASSLLLREIVLLTNADYQQLQNLGFRANSAASEAVDVAQLRAPAAAQQAESCSLRDVYDINDVADNAAYRPFLDEHAQRKIVLNTSYALCKGTPNSFDKASNPPFANATNSGASLLGKLTLKSISCFGPNNAKLFPDFKFQYNADNPNYNRDDWDGWGSYKAFGADSHFSEYSNPTAWHLTDIITPLGGRLKVEYESDDYGSISGEPIRQRVPIREFRATDATHAMVVFDTRNIPSNLRAYLSNGTMVELKDLVAKQEQRCWKTFGGSQDPKYLDYRIPATQRVQGLIDNAFIIERPRLAGGSGNDLQGCSDATWHSMTGALEVVMASKKGGGARVAAISTADEVGHTYRTGYLYTQEGTRAGTSSGVVAQEPELVRTVDYPFYHYYDYPNTPVLYHKVTVVEGQVSDTDYKQKTEYAFTTPDDSFMRVEATMLANQPLNWPYYGSSIQDSKLFYFDVKNYSSKIGRVERIKVLDKSGVEMASTEFTYTSELPGKQGVFTNGSILCEFQQGSEQTSSNHFKASRTLKTAYPNVLTSVRTVSNGVTTVRDNTAWDFLTGAVLQKDVANTQGEKYRSLTVPAHHKYVELRSKAENPANKHMLTQTTASYAYKLNGAGQPVSLVDAGIQTWNKDWNTYRRYNASSGQYESELGSVPVWRRHKSYGWTNNRPNAAGLTDVGTFVDFGWSAGAPNKNWRLINEVTAYNHFSAPLETKFTNGNFATSKRGHDNSLTIAEAQNARLGELAYSGAEDAVAIAAGTRHFGGEVRGAEFQSSELSHTGRYSLKLPPGQRGFLFESRVGAADGVEAGRSYRASAWLHRSDLAAAQGRLFAALVNGGSANALAATTITGPSVKQAGDWYLLDIYFDVPAAATGQLLQVGCEHAGAGSSPAYFDDFRFHPVDAPVTSYVYDPQTWQLTHVLNQDNLYTKYEYDAAGRRVKTYREVLKSPRADRLVSETRNNFARGARYAITATVDPATGNNGSVTPGGASTVDVGDDLDLVGKGIDCNWQPNAGFTVDGTFYNGSATLGDGTAVAYDQAAQTYRITNVGGPHNFVVGFTNLNHPAAGTWVEGSCEMDATGTCFTGWVTWRLTDGCGGYSAQESRLAEQGACVNAPNSGCVQLRQSTQSSIR